MRLLPRSAAGILNLAAVIARSILAMALVLVSGGGTVNGVLAGTNATLTIRFTVSPTTTAVVCLDVTSSVPRTLMAESTQVLAQTVESIPHAGSGPFYVYVRSITSNSDDPANNLLAFKIPGVPKPELVEARPFSSEQVKRAIAAANKRALATEARSLAAARQAAERYSQAIRHLNPPSDSKGTDLYGCPEVAARLMFEPGPKYLTVISDFLSSGPPQRDTRFSLRGSHGMVMQYCKEKQYYICRERVNAFSAVLRRAGVKPIVTRDFSSLSVITNLFTGT